MAAVPDEGLPARMVAGGAGILGGAVLVDSALEHYRGSFRDPFMAAPIAAATAMLVAGARRASGKAGAGGKGEHVAAVLVGGAGLGFHVWNVAKRPGAITWNNLFYGAPIGAPAALILAGAGGAAAAALAVDGGQLGPVSLATGRPLAGVAALGLAGTAAEAGLLHFRGAYHNPAMWAPVTLPPLAALSLARDVIAGTPRTITTALLGATAALGLLGAGFHAWGVHRAMGGWRNWRQNLLAGPPIPAPPAFTGLALVGLAALLLMRRRRG
jgi:MYXO-CTERM domain-containing protein